MYIRLGRPAEAVDDCTVVLEQDPNNLKGVCVCVCVCVCECVWVCVCVCVWVCVCEWVFV